MPEAIPILIAFLVRASLIALFLPFSAFDKIADHAAAVKQAREIGVGPVLAGALIVLGLGIEIICSLDVITGVIDRLAALILAAYCAALMLVQLDHRRQIITPCRFR